MSNRASCVEADLAGRVRFSARRAPAAKAKHDSLFDDRLDDLFKAG
jgi:hypothetical protein